MLLNLIHLFAIRFLLKKSTVTLFTLYFNRISNRFALELQRIYIFCKASIAVFFLQIMSKFSFLLHFINYKKCVKNTLSKIVLYLFVDPCAMDSNSLAQVAFAMSNY